MDRKNLCDEDCNHCPLIGGHKNSKMLTCIFNELFNKFGDGVYSIVQKNCPNLTCCYSCHSDDFTHVEGCEFNETKIGNNKKSKF